MTIEPPLNDGIWGLPGALVSPPLAGVETFTTTPLIELLRAAAVRTPESIALISPTTSLTYEDVLRLARNAASAIAAQVPPGQPIACILSRAPHSMAALLGCLISGRVALILDPVNAAERQAALLREVAPAAILLDQPLSFPVTVPVLTVRDVLAGPDLTWAADQAWDPDAPFVVHFTSGSTGQPKGIVLSARSLLHRGFEAIEKAALTSEDRIFCNALHVGGNGLSTLLGAVARGVRVLLATIGVDGAGAVLRLLDREAVTAAAIAQPLWRLLLRMDHARTAFRALHAFRVGAGAQPAKELASWRKALPPDCVIHHTYASTEALVVAQWFVPPDHTTEATVLAAGMIQPNHDYAILGDDGRPVPFGAVGELVLRSRYIALGEWRGGQVVPGRMIPAPDRPGWRIFRTGDLVRLQPDGMLRVVGRADRQVKINGVRVEPVEIEAVLRAEPTVTDAIVMARANGERVTLHGFVAAAGTDQAALTAALRRRLAAALPAVARPSRLTVLDSLPRLPSGKVDEMSLARWPTT